MNTDVERLLEEETEPIETQEDTTISEGEGGCCDYIYLYKMPHLTRAQLNGLDKYKYSAIDTSPLSKYIMHPFWNWLVQFFPMSLAPNVIMRICYVCLVIDYSLLAHYDWDFTANNTDQSGIPRWVWFVVAVLHAASHHLDGVDGKQARRTGSGTPLGELMDHGIDSNCMWMLPVTLMSVLGSDSSNSGIAMQYAPLLLLSLTFNFWISHWEKYNTGVLYLPWMFDIAQTTVVGLFLLTGILTPAGLKAVCAQYIAPMNTLFYIFIPLGFLGSLLLSVYNVYKSVQAGTHKQTTFLGMMRPWVSYIIMNLLLCSYTVFSEEDYLAHPRVWTIAYGFSFSSLVCRLMVNQMCSTDCDLIDPIIPPLGLAWFLGVVVGIEPTIVITVYSVFSMGSFFHLSYTVVNDICDHLNICCFLITRKRR